MPICVVISIQLSDMQRGGDPTKTAWIAARYDNDIPNEFRLGDSSKPGTGEYSNRPLLENQKYRVFVRAYTSNSVSNLLTVIVMVLEPS